MSLGYCLDVWYCVGKGERVDACTCRALHVIIDFFEWIMVLANSDSIMADFGFLFQLVS